MIRLKSPLSCAGRPTKFARTGEEKGPRKAASFLLFQELKMRSFACERKVAHAVSGMFHTVAKIELCICDPHFRQFRNAATNCARGFTCKALFKNLYRFPASACIPVCRRLLRFDQPVRILALFSAVWIARWAKATSRPAGILCSSRPCAPGL